MGSHELLMTEMILGGVFNNLDAPEIASLLSSLVFQAKSSKDDRGSDPKDLAPTDALKEVHLFFINQKIYFNFESIAF